jgi:probable HAF family extracellular repeat protein
MAPGGQRQACFLNDGTTMRDLGTLGGPTSVGVGINASGNVVGYADVLSGASHGFLYSGGGMSDLTAQGAGATPSAINDGNTVVGYYIAGGDEDAFVFESTGFHDLGTLGGQITRATSINSTGDVVGFALTSLNRHSPD